MGTRSVVVRGAYLAANTQISVGLKVGQGSARAEAVLVQAGAARQLVQKTDHVGREIYAGH